MKTAVEELSPTRVRLSVEIPFAEFKPSLDKAYREVSRQVRIPGFRPGRVPPPVIDSRVGRGAVLSQAFNDALPGLYDQAVRESELQVLGQPEVELTKLDDGEEITFTAEVEVRPKFELPDLDALAVTVDNAVVTPDDVEEYLNTLRERFASLKAVQRPVEDGDFVSIDLAASVDGKPVEDAQVSGVSYEVGSESITEGLDEAITGMSAGDSGEFRSVLGGGESAGEEADMTVTVHSVKVKEMPELDDDFAQLASEFDTLGELRGFTRRQLEQAKGFQQAAQARERVMQALLDSVDFPLPEGLIEHEVGHSRESAQEQLSRAGLSLADYLQSLGQTEEQFESGLADDAKRSVKTVLVLDAAAKQEEVKVEQNDLELFITEQAQRMGVPPDRLARQLSDSGQIGAVVGEVLRSKTLALLAERARVTDEAGHEINVQEVLAAAAAAFAQEAGATDTAETSETTEAAEEAGEPETAAEPEAGGDATAQAGTDEPETGTDEPEDSAS